MDNLLSYFPIIIYILLCVLITLLIVICVKVIKTMNRVEDIVNDVDEKVKSLNGVFNIVDTVTDKLSALTEVISDSIILFIKGLFKKKRKKAVKAEIVEEEDLDGEEEE